MLTTKKHSIALIIIVIMLSLISVGGICYAYFTRVSNHSHDGEPATTSTQIYSLTATSDSYTIGTPYTQSISAPIPRNTSRTASGSQNTVNDTSMSSTTGDTAVTGNHSNMRNASHSAGKVFGGSVRTSHTDAPSIRSSSVSGGFHTRAESASSERISERHSAERSNVHERHGYIQVPGRSTAPQQSIKHEYRDGKYNPAAVNKKGKRTVYKKETEVPQFSQRRSRKTLGGEHNGKRE